jgi:hypothetical protein
MTNTTELSKDAFSLGLRFFWSIREEDGAEIFDCRHSDGSSTEALSATELGVAEALIAALALA